MDLTVTVFARGLITVICVTLITVGIAMFRRTCRGEKAFTDKDWRLLFGKSKADLLTARYGGKLALAFLACGLLGLVEYVVLMPYGASWYGVGITLTAVAIVLFTPRALR